MVRSSIGLGHRPFTAERGVRFPYGLPRSGGGMVDTLVLGTSAARRESSNLSRSTIYFINRSGYGATCSQACDH